MTLHWDSWSFGPSPGVVGYRIPGDDFPVAWCFHPSRGSTIRPKLVTATRRGGVRHRKTAPPPSIRLCCLEGDDPAPRRDWWRNTDEVLGGWLESGRTPSGIEITRRVVARVRRDLAAGPRTTVAPALQARTERLRARRGEVERVWASGPAPSALEATALAEVERQRLDRITLIESQLGTEAIRYLEPVDPGLGPYTLLGVNPDVGGCGIERALRREIDRCRRCGGEDCLAWLIALREVCHDESSAPDRAEPAVSGRRRKGGRAGLSGHVRTCPGPARRGRQPAKRGGGWSDPAVRPASLSPRPGRCEDSRTTTLHDSHKTSGWDRFAKM